MVWRHVTGRLDDERGNVTLVMALCAIPVMFAVCGVVELSQASGLRARLQDAVDAGALAAAGRLGIANDDTSAVVAAGVAAASRMVDDAHVSDVVTYDGSVGGQRSSVTITARAEHRSLIGFMGFGDSTVSVSATADTLGSLPLCVLQTGDGGLSVRNSARIRASGCAIHANGDIKVDSGAMIQAARIQAAGTIAGPVSPMGNAGAMTIADPLGGLDLTPPSGCAGKPQGVKVVVGATLSLPAGVHCERFDIDKDATLALQAGEHWFMDDLKAHENAAVQGDDVALIFASTKKVDFADKASVQLSARRSGPFAGFLIVTGRDNTERFTIGSDHVSKLLGTIYIPSAELDVQTAGNVAQDSAWSIIVASSLKLTQNPVLVINNNYVGSGVPVPGGVGPRTRPTLSQ